MSYIINYAAACHRGKVRRVNQDNLWVNGVFLASENDGLPQPLVGTLENSTSAIFAVFDGMGGESCGEMAAFLAARAFNASQPPTGDLTKFMSEICLYMNDEICRYANTHKTGRMGTTACITAFGKKKIHIANIGDSKIFLYDGDMLTQISVDHIVILPHLKKAPLTQHLGVRREEFIIEPHFATGAYHNGDMYLICSDGLTDMVPAEEITAVLRTDRPVEVAVDTLMALALKQGGVDNITIVLCELVKKKWGLGKFFR